jgi:hypothetical protein
VRGLGRGSFLDILELRLCIKDEVIDVEKHVEYMASKH